MKIGPAVYRWRWLILLGWLAVGMGLCVLAPTLDPTAHEPTSFLPRANPYTQAARALQENFPSSSGLSQAVVVFERSDGRLSAEDFKAVETVAAAISKPRPGEATAADLTGIAVRSPKSLPLPTNPLKSLDGRAALVIVDVPSNFITIRSARIVDHVRAVAGATDLPAGLDVAVTGSSGFGHDYAAAAERSHERIGLITLIAVVIILLLVYRAPVAALVPLVAISAAAFVAMKILAVGQHFGMHIGTGEKVFVFVLIYGAGMDYSMLFISRFGEAIDSGRAKGVAAGEALGATLAAILASAGTDTLGLLMLSFAEYRAFRTSGAAIAAALIVALIASITLVPALSGILGQRLFWPARRAGRVRKPKIWPVIARFVTARPAWVLAAVIALLAIPAVRGVKLTWIYDALAELKHESPEGVGNSGVGIEAAQRHWPVGQIAPVTVLVQSPKPLLAARWKKLSGKLTKAASGASGVQDVRSLTQPLGKNADFVTRALLRAAASKTRDEYVSANGSAMRIQAVLDKPSLTLAAMADVAAIRQAVEKTLADANEPGLTVGLAGATAEMAQTRSVTQADFHRIAVLVLAVIFTMIFCLFRDAILAAFIVAATVLGYFATLGLAYWLILLAGQDGLDWKVEVFLFVVMVAVGVDYSIFLAARVSQEARGRTVSVAVSNALVHTGPVISSCGLIMAATLGSLMAGELKLFVQLGLALTLGMLIDTFIIRPMLLPAFITITGRTGKIPRFLE